MRLLKTDTCQHSSKRGILALNNLRNCHVLLRGVSVVHEKSWKYLRTMAAKTHQTWADVPYHPVKTWRDLRLRASCDWFLKVNVFLWSYFFFLRWWWLWNSLRLFCNTHEMSRKITQPSTKSVTETHRNSNEFLFPWTRKRSKLENKRIVSC